MRVLGAATAALILASCALPPAPPPRQPSTGASGANPLASTSWVLATLAGQAPVANTAVTLNFAADGSAGGQDGCNTYNTSYTVSGSSLTFGPTMATAMACEEAVMSQATAFQQALSETRQFTIADGALTLSDASGQALATFSAQNTDLTGTKWIVTGYNNGNQAVVGVLEGTELTAAFGADGVVSGSGGCNNYTGPYIVDSTTIAIGPLASTMMACESPEGVMEQEARFLAAMQTAATYVLDANSLTLRTADDAMAVTLQRAP